MTELLISAKDALLLSKIQKTVQKNREDTNICDRMIKVIISKMKDRDDNGDNNDQIISNKHKHEHKMILTKNKDQDAEESND